MNVLQFDTDKAVHEAGADGCRACVTGYPKAHGCGGIIHAEHRYDMEAGFTWTYLYSRCDGCDHQSSEEVKPSEVRRAS